ncbi:MAG: glycosyl hydrolase [Anaerolineae bacterium]|nr:glycosyl hydrolase [Anaerolineae bacterium]
MAKSRIRNKRQSKSALRSKTTFIMAAAAVVIFGVLYLTSRLTGGLVQFRDIHGLSFSSDGSQLFVPAHDGLRVYENGGWTAPDLPVNDYMGYSGTDSGFYSSGHPGPGSNLVNPFGLIRSTDGGETIQTLAFAGETDFHLMTAGYESHTVYVVNPAQNSRLPAGLHYTLDVGQTWQQSTGRGISGRPIQLAAHPTEPGTVAVAAEGGLFLSNDYGDTFTRVGDPAPVTAVTFDPNGERLLFAYQGLSAYDLATGQTASFQTPSVTGDDAVGYIAVNPASDQIAFATFARDIYLSEDKGQSWEAIAEQGVSGS